MFGFVRSASVKDAIGLDIEHRTNREKTTNERYDQRQSVVEANRCRYPCGNTKNDSHDNQLLKDASKKTREEAARDLAHCALFVFVIGFLLSLFHNSPVSCQAEP